MLTQEVINFIKPIIEVINAFFVVYLIGYSTILFAACVFGSINLFDRFRMRKLENKLPNEHFMPVSLIVPSYNEELAILGTIYSLLNLDYNSYEIIVVNDGSKDNTIQVLAKEFGLVKINSPIRMQLPCNPAIATYEAIVNGRSLIVIDKENGGKADALNLGINMAKYPYFVTVDADTMLDEMALKNIMMPAIEDDSVIAVGGVVRPSNSLKIVKGKIVKPSMPKNFIACMQAFEYDRSFLSSRLLFDKINATLIISGAFGLYRKKEVIAVGGFRRNTIGEDMELVVKLHSYCKTNSVPYRTCYAPEAVCWTQVPEKIKDYVKQRRRWHIGLFQSLQAYFWLMLRESVGVPLRISYAYYFIYEFLSPIIEVVGVAAMVFATLIGLVNVQFMILLFAVYIFFGWMLTLSAFFTRIHTSNVGITKSDALKAFTFCLFENTFLRFILLFARLTAFVNYKKNRFNWNKVERHKVKFIK